MGAVPGYGMRRVVVEAEYEAFDAELKAVEKMLRQHRGLVNKLLSNPFLAESFWRDTDNPKAKGWATQDANYLDKNLKEHDYCRVLSQAISRLYILRGQIVHGASTGGSSLNRTSPNCWVACGVGEFVVRPRHTSSRTLLGVHRSIASSTRNVMRMVDKNGQAIDR